MLSVRVRGSVGDLEKKSELRCHKQGHLGTLSCVTERTLMSQTVALALALSRLPRKLFCTVADHYLS